MSKADPPRREDPFNREVRLWREQVAKDTKDKPQAFRIAWFISDRFNRKTFYKTGRLSSFPGQETIARDASITVRSVQVALKPLFERGHFEPLKKRGPYQVSEYTAILKDTNTSSPLKHEESFALDTTKREQACAEDANDSVEDANTSSPETQTTLRSNLLKEPTEGEPSEKNLRKESASEAKEQASFVTGGVDSLSEEDIEAWFAEVEPSPWLRQKNEAAFRGLAFQALREIDDGQEQRRWVAKLYRGHRQVQIVGAA